MTKKEYLPKESDFPVGTRFLIMEWDVPLSKQTSDDGKTAAYFNWYGGNPSSYSAEHLKIDNNWPADSFSHWLDIVKDSMN